MKSSVEDYERFVKAAYRTMSNSEFASELDQASRKGIDIELAVLKALYDVMALKDINT
jgi:hypothetical protein